MATFASLISDESKGKDWFVNKAKDFEKENPKITIPEDFYLKCFEEEINEEKARLGFVKNSSEDLG